jgi:hypothetical protein
MAPGEGIPARLFHSFLVIAAWALAPRRALAHFRKSSATVQGFEIFPDNKRFPAQAAQSFATSNAGGICGHFETVQLSKNLDRVNAFMALVCGCCSDPSHAQHPPEITQPQEC